MSSGSFKQADVRCPYYIYDDGKHNIICEGIIPDTTTRHHFRYKKDRELQLAIFCSEAYWRCEHCIALDDKYKED